MLSRGVEDWICRQTQYDFQQRVCPDSSHYYTVMIAMNNVTFRDIRIFLVNLDLLPSTHHTYTGTPPLIPRHRNKVHQVRENYNTLGENFSVLT